MSRTNLKLFRVKQKLSQEAMAEKIGCKRATYSAIECGKRQGRHNFWAGLQAAFCISDSDMWELMSCDD